MTKWQTNIAKTTMMATKELLQMKTHRFIEKNGVKAALIERSIELGVKIDDVDSLKAAEKCFPTDLRFSKLELNNRGSTLKPKLNLTDLLCE